MGEKERAGERKMKGDWERGYKPPVVGGKEGRRENRNLLHERKEWKRRREKGRGM